MGVFNPVVFAHPAWPVAARQAQITGGGAVRRQLARGDGLQMDALIA